MGSDMNKKINKFLCAIFSFFLIFFEFSCGSLPKSKGDAYYSQNIKEFSFYTLDNSIPVIFKKTQSGQVFVLRMVFEGGTPLVDINKAGIENLALELMFHGSKNYSYEDIQKMQYDITFAMNTSSGRDYSLAGLKCLNKDLDTVLDVFADSILNPSFSKEDFNQFMINEREKLARTLSEPSGQLGVELEKAAFGSTSYASAPDITRESIDSISLEAVIQHHKALLDSKRIKIVIVSNSDEKTQKELINKLNYYFASIKKGNYKTPVVSKISVTGENINIKNEQAGTSGYSIGFFDCPERYDNDYVPFAIALMILDDIFFDQVREKNGAVYSIGTGVLGGKQMLGAISAYKISDIKNIHSLIENAVESFPDEKEISVKLDQYKNKYITTLFSSSQNATGVAANIITSLEYSGHPETYLNRSAQVQSVTARQVRDAYKKYISNGNPKKWVTVTK